ncbi:hypothetical protein V6N13_007664 [Hibiscus sabdariffa]
MYVYGSLGKRSTQGSYFEAISGVFPYPNGSCKKIGFHIELQIYAIGIRIGWLLLAPPKNRTCEFPRMRLKWRRPFPSRLGAPTPPCPALYLTLRRKRGYEAWETMERGVRLQREMLKTFNEMHPPRPGRYGVVAAAAIRKQAAKPSKRTKRR